MKLPPPSSSESWRKLYERSKYPSILGQLQEDPCMRYPVLESLDDSLTATSDTDMEMCPDSDDLKGAWRSVLACGKSLERQLNGDASGTNKPLLSTVVSFVRNAYGLPLPESCFGTQHVMIEEVSNCMLTLLEHVDKAREVHAKLMDLLYDEQGEGVDMDALQKFLDASAKALPVRLDISDELLMVRERVVDWERRLNDIMDSARDDIDSDNRDDLERVKELANEARCHGLNSKSLVELHCRIRRAHQIQKRIIEWKKACEQGEKSTIKSIASMVRDALRLKLIFPEIRDLLCFHREQEDWADRASIAIRSRISLTEVKSLILRGEHMPLDLSDYLDKLRARVRTGEEWIDSLCQVVPSTKSDFGSHDMLVWMSDVREAIHNGMQSRLHDLASEGSRIPVEVDHVKLLQIELDAKNWAMKAKKWIPSEGGSRRGKLEDLREHVKKASILREKLTLSDADKEAWVLEGEEELISIVEAADKWFEEVRTLHDSCLHQKIVFRTYLS